MKIQLALHGSSVRTPDTDDTGVDCGRFNQPCADKHTRMKQKETASKIVFGLSWIIAGQSVGATGLFIYGVLKPDPFASLFFLSLVAPGLAVCCLFLSLISGIFFCGDSRRDNCGVLSRIS